MKTTRIFHLFVAILLAAALLPVQAPAQAQSSGPVSIGEDTLFVPGELIIGFSPGLSSSAMDAKAGALAGSVGAQVAKTYDNMALLSLDPDADLNAAAQQVRAQIGVEYAERNYIRRLPTVTQAERVQVDSVTRKLSTGGTLDVSIDRLKSMRSLVRTGGKIRSIPTYPENEWENWGAQRIGHDIIWPEKSSSPWVCVVDTGVDAKHPALKGRVSDGFDFINNDRVAQDDFGHGTHVAGVIVGQVGSGPGPAGISNGNVLAVKVLGAQGWGTDFDVASGIRYCANNSKVKVINLSLGGSLPSYTTYSALDYAVNTMGKLVVAAAGNDSTSVPEYPAAWASTEVDGIDKNGTPINNEVAKGMLSVGAAIPGNYAAAYGQPWGPTWVDANNSGDRQANEEFFSCAARFSNYGRWVEVVAPGEAIWSTVPISYPYYFDYYLSDPSFPVEIPGYDTWSGTSMATPHVAAAAARLWSINRDLSNTGIHDLLIAKGEPLNLAVNTNVVDPTRGFKSSGFPAGSAPFCWPKTGGSYGAEQDMSASVYINLSLAMNRGILTTMAYDSVSGLPLQGAKVQAQDNKTGLIKDTSLVQASLSNPWTDLINLPASEVVATDPSTGAVTEYGAPFYNMRISKPGYTFGYQTYDYAMPVLAGTVIWDPWWGIAAVPPRGKTISVVGQWRHNDYPFGYDQNLPGAGDIDLYLWLPQDQQTIVGPEKYTDVYAINPYSETGTLVSAPFARYHRDGGLNQSGQGGMDWINIETIEIKNRRSSVLYPGEYQIYMTNNTGGNNELNDAYPLVTVWQNGRIIGWSFQGYDQDGNHLVTDPGHCDTGETWWYGGKIAGNRFFPQDACGTVNDLPYWIAP